MRTVIINKDHHKLLIELTELTTVVKKLIAEKLSDDTAKYSSKEIDRLMKKRSEIEKQLAL